MANQVPYVQSQIAQNLRGGLASLGNRPLEEAKFGLDKLTTEYNINRQKAADQRAQEVYDLQKPAMEVQSQVAQNQIDEAKTPLRASMLMPDVNSVEHWFWTPQDSEKRKGQKSDPMIAKFANMYGGTWDTDENSPTRGQLLRPDGTPVTLLDAHRNAEPIKAFIIANSGLKHNMQNAKEKLLRSFESGKMTKPEYDQKLGQLVEFESSPTMQMQYAKNQIDTLSRFGNTGNPLFNSEITNGLQRWQKKYDKLANDVSKQIETEAKNQFELKKLEITEGGKDKRKAKDIEQQEADRVLEIEKMLSKERTELAKDGKLPANVKGAQDLFKHLTDTKGESAGAILARALAGAQMGEGVDRREIDIVKTQLDKKTRNLLDRSIEILENYYGVPQTTPPQASEITHDYIPGKGFVVRSE